MNTNVILQPVSTDNILALLEQQKDNFHALAEFVKSKDIKPSRIFLPQTLKVLDAEFSVREDLILDCIDYLDVIKIYSISVYGDSESYLEEIKRTIVENRTANSNATILAQDALDDFMFTSKEEATTFLNNNKLLIALYLYSLVNLIFYTEA